MVSGDVQQCYTAKERGLQHTSAQLHAGETVTLQKLVWIDWRDDGQLHYRRVGQRVASPA